MMIFGSLFAGIGGFDKGFHDAGMSCAWQVEIDAAARGVLARHNPGVPQFADIRDCGAHNLAPADIICGGFPCQDLSVAGKRGGLAGARSGLFYEMVRIVNELQPKFLVWENVPGLLSGKYESDEEYHTCICGWVSGWRRVYHDNGEQETVLLPDDLYWDDGEGVADTKGTSGSIWRGNQRGQEAHRQVGRFGDADNIDGRGAADAERYTAIPHPESRTMPNSALLGDTNQTSQRAGRRNMGQRLHDNSAGDGGRDTSIESEGAATGVDDGRTTTQLCPSCGRTLGTPATRHVQRSWMGDVLRALADIGYFGAWSVLDAQWFGVAQRRQRVFGVFARRDIGAERCAEILSFPARLPWNTEARRTSRAGVAAAIAASAGHHGHSNPRGDGSDNLISFNVHSYAQDASAASVSPTLAADHGVGLLTGAQDVRNVLSAHHGRNSGEDTFVVGMTPRRSSFERGSDAPTLNSGDNSGGFRTEPGEHLAVVAGAQSAPATVYTTDRTMTVVS